MKKYSAGNTRWSLTEEGLESVVEQFIRPENKRRHYMVLEYQGGKVFIKSFLERGIAGHIRHFISPRGKVEFQISMQLLPLPYQHQRSSVTGSEKTLLRLWRNISMGKVFSIRFRRLGNRDGLLILLADFLKQLRQKHIRHNDLHLDNILMQGDTLYLIDLHKTKIKKDLMMPTRCQT